MSEFVWPIRVYYEDTDAGGVVFYANYLKFMERARTEWLRQLGFHQAKVAEEEGVVFAVRDAALDFRAPARLDDLLQVSSRVVEQRKASLVIAQQVRVDADGKLLCEGRITVVCVNAESFRPCPIPKRLFAEMSDGE